MQKNLFEEDKFNSILPKKINISQNGISVNVWEINQTISQLAYLTHSYFRYYGKFPSTLASQLLEDYPAPPDGILLDNFSGSGTSLLEAARRNIKSVGIDINPLATLSGQVKTNAYDINILHKQFKEIKSILNNKSLIFKDIELPEEKFLKKWFFDETIDELTKLKGVILNLEPSKYSKFFTLAFLSIIRRVSKAYDGEVRPHINKEKKIRSPFQAFKKKVDEMIEIQADFQNLYNKIKPAETFIASTKDDFIDILPSGNYWLVISHPPYLNCFDYIPVFSLELNWSLGFDDVWRGRSYKEVQGMELKSWPATKQEYVDNYYEGLRCAYINCHKIQPIKGKLAIVVGDCTIKGKLEAVHQKVITIVEAIGYELIELNYRTTHYSTGKYSYQHRADYHGEEAEKKDAILVFEKVKR